MTSHAVDVLGGLDVLHNNVGVGRVFGDAPVVDIKIENFERVMAINLTGMMTTCKHVIPVMQSQGGGVILGIGSLASVMYHPLIAYQASKVGVVALMQNIAFAHASDGIRANAILPGFINTPMAIEPQVGSDPESRESLNATRDSRVPLGRRQGTAEDVANAAVFLASDLARFITGVVLPVDGGQSLNVD